MRKNRSQALNLFRANYALIMCSARKLELNFLLFGGGFSACCILRNKFSSKDCAYSSKRFSDTLCTPRLRAVCSTTPCPCCLAWKGFSYISVSASIAYLTSISQTRSTTMPDQAPSNSAHCIHFSKPWKDLTKAENVSFRCIGFY